MKVLVTGAFGCVGANYADHCLSRGDKVIAFDNNARGESNTRNEVWLRGKHKSAKTDLKTFHGDIGDRTTVRQVFGSSSGVDAVVHCAAQSSVNRSIDHPELDFCSNVVGTFNILEAVRTLSPDSSFIFMASNKIYDVTQWPVEVRGNAWKFSGRPSGPGETVPFYTDAREPYGASKICGMYYTRCYAAMYGLNAVIVTPSGMYGERQFGKEEQGWLAWMAICAQLGLTFHIKGDGLQTRDMLHTSDVNSALDLLINVSSKMKGEVFNLGGGPRNAISLIEAKAEVEANLKKPLKVVYEDWRPQDNKCYISNVGKLIDMGWYPKVDIRDGIAKICAWVRQEEVTLKELYREAN